MKIKHLLPFLLLLSILGGGVYWLIIKNGERKEPDLQLQPSDELVRIFNTIDSLKLNPLDNFGRVTALIDSIETSKLSQNEQDQMTEKLGEKAVALFHLHFLAWVSSGFGYIPPEVEFQELRVLVSETLNLQSNTRVKLQTEFPMYAKAFVLYKLYFQPGSPNQLDVRLNRLRKLPYKPQRYEDLLNAFNSNSGLLDGLSPVKDARNEIEWQRQCHELVNQHYQELEESSIINTDHYNKYELPLNVNVQKNFTCGARSYGIYDFDYYHRQGRDLEIWKQAIW